MNTSGGDARSTLSFEERGESKGEREVLGDYNVGGMREDVGGVSEVARIGHPNTNESAADYVSFTGLVKTGPNKERRKPDRAKSSLTAEQRNLYKP